MMFFERKAFIEFLDFTKVRITTPFIQKEFELKDIPEDQNLDLILLKQTSESNLSFYATLNDTHSVLEIYIGNRHIGEVSFGDDSKLFKAKILEND